MVYFVWSRSDMYSLVDYMNKGDEYMQGKKIPYGVQTNFSVFEDTMVEMTWQEIQSGAGLFYVGARD